MEPDRDRVADSHQSDLSELRLLHLADSALPIGGLAHSFGLETLTSSGILGAADLPSFLRGYLEEAGLVEAVFCREAYGLASWNEQKLPVERWIALNGWLTARKSARELCAGSAALGLNFLQAVVALGDFPVLHEALLVAAKTHDGNRLQPPPNDDHLAMIHHSTAFGLASGVLRFEVDRAVLAFLHQLVASLVSASQRLMPLGQAAATRILWNLKPTVIQTAQRSATCSLDDAYSFTPLLDWGGMEHPALSTRLFVS